MRGLTPRGWRRLGALFAALGLSTIAHAYVILPVEWQQEATHFNLGSFRGVPLSPEVGNPPGSDGRGPTGRNQSGSYNTTTSNQFQSVVFFGAGASPTDWRAKQDSPHLVGVGAFSATTAEAMQLPLARNGSNVVWVARGLRIGAPFLSRSTTLSFGSIVQVPATDENGHGLDVVKETYWLPEPYSTNDHSGLGYYWSSHAERVHAIQPGPVRVTWRKATPYTAATRPPAYVNPGGGPSYETNGANFYLLHTLTYVVSGSAVKPPRTMYWTEREFRALGRPVSIPSSKVGAVNIVYNTNFPRTVPQEYHGPGYTSPTEGSTNNVLQELRTLWYDQAQGFLQAYNFEGRVFVELLGDLRASGQTRVPLGFEIVDVIKQPTPLDVDCELGERLLPPAGIPVTALRPEEIQQTPGLPFNYQYYAPGSTLPELYASRATANQNDCLVHWLETGVEGLLWPKVLGRHHLIWPDDVAKYSHYVRPRVDTDTEAAATAVPLNPQNVPAIAYQDPLDVPRAKLTPDSKFYTFLTPAQPAHRTLLRYTVSDRLAFERVFSWLETTLRDGDLAGTVATNLAAVRLHLEDPGTPLWADELVAPRVVTGTAWIGERLTPPAGEPGGTGDYLAGYINQSQGNLFHPGAYVDPLAQGFTAANGGAIIPVNTIPGTNRLEVWWFRPNQPRAGLNAGNTKLGFTAIYWPAYVGRYTIAWPGNPREIVLASKLGSGTLDSYEAQATIYAQNQRELPGYNPNEEHALMYGGQAFATRDDLNLTRGTDYSSEPYVLLNYTAADRRPAMSVFKVLREKPEAGYVFDYIVPVGQMLQPPPPLMWLPQPVEGTGMWATDYNTEVAHPGADWPDQWQAADASGPRAHYASFTWKDRKQNSWVYRAVHAGIPALAAGGYNLTRGGFDPLPAATAVVGEDFAFTVHASRQDEHLALLVPSALPAWLRIAGLTLLGKPAAADVGATSLEVVVADLYDGSRVTNTLALAVVSAGDVITQGRLVIPSTNAYTGVATWFDTRPPYLAAPPTSSNSFTMRFYYKTDAAFDWPGVTNPPPAGSIVPYLRPLDSATGTYVGRGDSRHTESLEIVYRPVWPVRDPKDSSKPLPTLPFGATLAKPAFNLPGVRDMKTARVLYQQSLARQDLGLTQSVVLHDATRAKFAALADHELTALPTSVRSESYQGRYYFPALPPHLAKRLYFDPNRGAKGSLVLVGDFVEAAFGENYLLLNVLRGSDLQAALNLCPASDTSKGKWYRLVGALATDLETFMESRTTPGTYVADTNRTVKVTFGSLAEVVSDETAVDSYALSATGPGYGYVTIIEANGWSFTQPGDPVAMHVFKVGGSLHTGELKVLPAENPLSEMVTFQHTADLAGRFDEFEYQWKIAAPVDGLPPVADAEMSRYLVLDPSPGRDLPRITLGGAGIQALTDNYVVMRYRPMNPTHPLYSSAPTAEATNWSDWTEPQLAEGWIKRVLAGINPFGQRLTDLYNNAVNSDVSMLTQAGRRWEGDVALNLDTINDYGLIEIYETVLRRGRSLSIESGYNFGPANDALLLAAGYLHDLYMMLGGEAWADAANPTIGIGTKDRTYGDIATALFAFKGQVASLAEEELALLRGRDDFLLPGVRVSPVYNRLVWNYTRGIDSGEVIYALNYNIQEDPTHEPDGILNAADAAILYPQGHGDAYGHYLTGIKGYYSLLMNSCFDWVPRIEAVSVLGQPVSVDYQDERKFAAGALALARAGQQVVDLTWRQSYQPPGTGWEHLRGVRTNAQHTFNTVNGSEPVVRHWGLDHWASRVGQGAYVNWVVGNAILLPEDTNEEHEGIRKVDRTTVPELQEVATLASSLQTSLDNAEGGLSPLGVPEGGLAFDLDPTAVVGAGGATHFEQIYERTKVALNNAVASFDDAKDVTRLMRSEQDSLDETRTAVSQQELAYRNRLIELYGTPYPEDVGPGKTWTQGYTGPDLIHYAYVNLPETVFGGQVTLQTETTVDISALTLKTDWVAKVADWSDTDYQNVNWVTDSNAIRFTWGPHGFFGKPDAWTGQRQSPGRIQQAISELIKAHYNVLGALGDAQGAKAKLAAAVTLFKSKQTTAAAILGMNVVLNLADEVLMYAQAANDCYEKFDELTEVTVSATTTAARRAIPTSFIAGMSNGGDLTSAMQATLTTAGFTIESSLKTAAFIRFVVLKAFASFTTTARRWAGLTIAELQANEETKARLVEIGWMVDDLGGHFSTISARLRDYDDALRAYQALLAEGDRIQEERLVFRQRAAEVIQGYRTRDAAFRLFRNEKLERYKTLFDLAARYALLAANAYDYETGLLGTSQGRDFKKRIVDARALGIVRNGEPQYAGSNTGDPGLSSTLAEMKADWDVLRGRLGFNNPDAYGTTVSLRTEALRILPTSDGDANWKDTLQQARMRNILEDTDVRRHCMQVDDGSGLPVPGLVLTFSTTIADGYNLFGRELAAGDHAFSPSAFATKIFGVGIALVGYRGMDDPALNGATVTTSGGTSPTDPDTWYLDPLALAATPYVYLIPVGVDSMRSPPLGDTSSIRNWTVADVAIPMPFNLGGSDFSDLPVWQSGDSLTEPLFTVRKHQAFRPVSTAALFSPSLYGGSGTLLRSQFTNNRLVGRSAWNSQWKLVIPGRTLLNNPQEGLDRFVQTVTDVKLHFVTYSYSGN